MATSHCLNFLKPLSRKWTWSHFTCGGQMWSLSFPSSKSGLNKDVDAKTKNRISPQLLLQSHFILTHLCSINVKLKLIEGTCSKSSVCYASMNDSFAKNSLDLNRNVLRNEVIIMMVGRQNAERQQVLFSQINTNIRPKSQAGCCVAAVHLKVMASSLTRSQNVWLIGPWKYLSQPRKNQIQLKWINICSKDT